MKAGAISFLSGIFAPLAVFAANEGVPSYYQTTAAPNANQVSYGRYANQGYTKYVGQNGVKQTVGSRTYTYQAPRVQMPNTFGTMTPNGVALPPESENKTTLSVGYARRFADFEFETGVNSILEWDDMIWNEIHVGARHNFSLRNFDMYLYGQYAYGDMSHGGLSMDYDLKPFDEAYPEYGIFTISTGDQSGRSNHFKFGIAAHHIWDIGGWKLSPTFGYEIFKHNLEMANHYYPNPGVYLPLMTDTGNYVYGDELGQYFSVPVGSEVPDHLYQVCMSPEDIKVVTNAATGTGADGFLYLGDALVTGDYTIEMGTIPWGVDSGECVIIGGDGPIIVEGTTHIYNTTWSGFYVGLEIEKQMTLKDKLRLYMQFGLPKYSSEGIWPNRTDWQQNPSFLDEGSNGAYSYAAEMEYNYKLSDRLQLSLRADTNLFHVGKIPGELYVAEYSQYVVDENGQYVMQELYDEFGNVYYVPLLETVAAHTEQVTDSLKRATWQSFSLHIGFKYAF